MDHSQALNIVGVSGVILNGAGEVLLIRTATAGWELPGGRVEPGEDLVAALRREALEETGYTVEPARLVGVYAVVLRSTVIVTFRCSVDPGEPAPVEDEDSPEVGWFAPRQALSAVTHVGEHQRLADALADAPNAVYRAFLD